MTFNVLCYDTHDLSIRLHTVTSHLCRYLILLCVCGCARTRLVCVCVSSLPVSLPHSSPVATCCPHSSIISSLMPDRSGREGGRQNWDRACWVGKRNFTPGTKQQNGPRLHLSLPLSLSHPFSLFDHIWQETREKAHWWMSEKAPSRKSPYYWNRFQQAVLVFIIQA